MKGFDPEFHDLDHYIRVITDRIWEGRRLQDIERYYGADCAVETPSSVSIGIEPVIAGTRATLQAFPDRRLLAEDVIVSGDEDGGFLSSHRILSPMIHAGAGVFGPPTGRPVVARTIADCVCIANRIVHEWLVRDQAAIARAIGLHERDLAARWLRAGNGRFSKPPMPPAPAPYVSAIAPEGPAADYAEEWLQRLRQPQRAAPLATLHPDLLAWVPGGEARVGAAAMGEFWQGLGAAFPGARLAVEHLAAQPRPGRATSIAMRWRLDGEHAGPGRYGEPTGAPVSLLGISHAEWENGSVVREWVLLDEVATWMQLLSR